MLEVDDNSLFGITLPDGRYLRICNYERGDDRLILVPDHKVIAACKKAGVVHVVGVPKEAAVIGIASGLLDDKSVEEICLTRTPEGIRVRVETFEVARCKQQ